MNLNKPSELIRKHLPSIDKITNRAVAEKVENIWYHTWKMSKWERLEDAPFNSLCPGVRLIDHTNAVVEGAMRLAKIREELFGDEIDVDILLAGALLHDVSKLLEYEPGERGVIKGKQGSLFQHGFWTAHRALMEGLPIEVIHIIISHTGESRLLPSTPEALIIYFSDMADADLHRLNYGVPLLMQKGK